MQLSYNGTDLNSVTKFEAPKPETRQGYSMVLWSTFFLMLSYHQQHAHHNHHHHHHHRRHHRHRHRQNVQHRRQGTGSHKSNNHNEQASDEHYDQSYCDMGIAELLALVAHAKWLQESRQSKLRMICPGTQFSPSSFRAARAASLSASSVTPLGALHRKVEMPAALFKPS